MTNRSLPPLESINPATEALIRSHPQHSPPEITAILDEVDGAQSEWSRVGIEERGERIRAFGRVLEGEKDELASLIASEMGKPVTQARSEIDKSVSACEHYADHGWRYIAPERVETDFEESFVRFDPLGVVLAIMPWNFPVWQVVRMLAPALLAGNGVVLKHASNVSSCALALESVGSRALPAGLFRTVLCRSGAIDQVVEDDRVAAVCLTGSTPSGAAVAAKAGSMLKKQVLELGGSDPFIVLDDAKVEEAVRGAVASRFGNAGQSCVAAKRFIVSKRLADEFTDRFVEAASSLRVGDPLDAEVELGPLARSDLIDEISRQVEESVAMGARLLTGGRALDGPGYFYAPTVLNEVTGDMPVVAEETFGPAAAILEVESDAEAVNVANASEFGLGASIWTEDRGRAESIAAELDVGSVYVNTRVSSDVRLPFGGVKQSGYGRELGSFGIRELTNIKSVAHRSLR